MKKKRTTKLISLGLCLGLLLVAVLGVATVAGAQNDVLPHVHECDSWTTTTALTCAQNGERSGRCTICNQDVTEPIPATGVHTYENGVCTVCKKTFSVEKDADGYYLLDDADKLYWFAEQVNKGQTDEYGERIKLNAKLTADIVVNSGVLNADGTPNTNAYFSAWTPIGNSTYPYTGTFDGQGHTISGLYRENTDSSTYVGLFGYVMGGTVKNVAVKDSYISRGEFAGGIAGYNCYGTIENCSNAGTVMIKNGDSLYAGGIVGYNASGTIENCSNAGTVMIKNGDSLYAGGIAGYNDGTITNCHNTGSVAVTGSGSGSEVYSGGIAGYTDSGNITNCANAGNVMATDSANDSEVYSGGIAAYNGGATIANCSNAGMVTATSTASSAPEFYSGGIAGYNNYATIKDCYNTGTAGGTGNNVGGIAGYNGSGKITNCANAGTVTLTGNATNYEYVSGGIVGYNDSGKITDCSNVGTVTATRTNAYSGGIAGYNVSGTITNCSNSGTVTATANNSLCGGIVGYNDSGEITNCANSGATSGSNYCGGIAGYNDSGAITGCSNSGTMSGSNCAGGIVGNNGSGTITNCYNTGKVTAAGSSEACSGGIAGYNDGTITYCYNTGDVAATGSFETYSGGIAGQNGSGTLGNCHATGTVTATAGSGGYASRGDIVGASFSSGSATDCEYYSTSDKFSDGTVAYLLNQEKPDPVWRQTLGTDATPNFTGEKVALAEGEGTGYQNAHDYVNGICAYCGEYEQPVWDKTDGYYQIANAGNLYWFAEKVSLGYTDLLAELTADITVNESVLTDGKLPADTDTSALRQWTPIGSDSNKYEGTFDGNGHTISGLYYNGSDIYVGLFGYVMGGTVKNVGVKDSYLKGTNYVGGIVGYSTSGEITNCYNTGTVSGGTDASVGGIAGLSSNGAIKNCYNTGTVSGGTDAKVGGIVGVGNFGSFDNCYYLGTSETDDIEGTTYKTEDQFASGEVTYLLNGSTSEGDLVWKQTLSGEGKQDLPAFSGGTVYYGYQNCADGATQIYANTVLFEKRPAHGTSGYTYTHGDGTHQKQCKACGNAVEDSKNCTFTTDGFCTVCDGYEKPTGAGAADDPYQIANAGNLYWFAAQVNGTPGGESKCAVLTADITVNPGTFAADGTYTAASDETPRQWTPIGTDDQAYTGTFNGQNHTISGLYYNGSDIYVGLFGYIKDGAVIKNVGVIDSYFQTNASATAYVGGLAGRASTALNAITVENCYATGTVNAYSDEADAYVGGLVGYVTADSGSINVENCYATGTVNAYSDDANAFAGGLVGYTHTYGARITVKNCYATGKATAKANATAISRAGGLVGFNSTSSALVTIDNCYYLSGSATQGVGNDADATGVTGMTADQFASGEVAYLLNGDQTTVVWHQTIGTDVLPNFTSTQIVYTYKNCKDEVAYANEQKADGAHPGFANGFCTACGGYEKPAQDDSDCYLIDNAGKLYWFSQYVNVGNTSINGKLTADITVNPGTFAADGTYTPGEGEAAGTTPRQWTPIGKGTADATTYNGTFDGQGHTISGLYYSGSADYVGMFGSVGMNGKVQNVTVKDTYFKGGLYVGGIVGYNKGTVTNCISSGTVIGTNDVGGIVGFNYGGKLTGCTNSGSVSGTNSVGGMVGENNAGTITSCHNSGAVSGENRVGGIVGYNSGGTIAGTADQYTTNSGTVSGEEYVGGIVGENENASSGAIGTIRYCENSAGGTVTGADDEGGTVQFTGGIVGYNNGGTVENCQNKAAVTGAAYVGGIVGTNGSSGEVSHCKNSGAVNGKDRVGGIVGQNGGTVAYCENSAKVMSAKDGDMTQNAGGIVGLNSNNAEVSNCKNSGDVSGVANIGGIVGYQYEIGKVTLCENSGAISGWSGIGGIMGGSYSYNTTLSDCINSGTITGTNYTYEGTEYPSQCIGGIVGGDCDVLRCINVGTVTGGQNVGSIVGETEYGSVENSYYLSATETADGGKTAAQFASGEVAYLLNGSTSEGTLVWKQTLDGKSYPGFTGGTVYKLTNTGCSGAPAKYSNDASEVYAPAHGASGYTYTHGDGTHQKLCALCGEAVEDSKNCDFNTDGFCTVCDGYQKPTGAGTVDDPYQIANAGNLYWFADFVNQGGENIKANAVLTADITVNPGTFAADGTYTAASDETPRQWTRIGNDGHAYTGTFDGKNHTIFGLYYNGSDSFVGLFGYIWGGATIQNVAVTNSYFQTSNSGPSLGGIVGNAQVANGNTITISGCSSAAYLVATDGYMVCVGGVVGGVVSNYDASVTIQNCANTGKITASSASGTVYCGGVVGYVTSYRGNVTIQNCANTGELSATSTATDGSSYCGGVAGSVITSEGSVTLQNCFSTGNLSAKAANRAAYCGGVAGYVGAVEGAVTIKNCFSTGNLSATSNNTNDSYCGGVAGYAYASVPADAVAEVKISNCYYTVDNLFGATKCDGDGASMTLEANKKTAAQFASGEVAYLLNGDQTTVVWKQTLGTDKTPNFTSTQTVYKYTNCAGSTSYANTKKDDGSHIYDANGFCTVKAGETHYEPCSTSDGVYQIANAGNLYWFADFVNQGGENIKANAVLTADITVNPGTFAADGTYTPGEGEAAGTTPRQWTPIGDNNNRFTGTFDGKNFTISGLYFNNSTADCVGLFGSVGGKGVVKNVKITDSYFSGQGRVGSIVGYSFYGNVENCSSSATVKGCGANVGGIVGESNEGSIVRCANFGNVDSSSKSVGGVCGYNVYGSLCAVYNTGKVTGTSNVGGLVGQNDGSVTDGYNIGAVSGSSNYVGGIVGLNQSNGTCTNCYYLKDCAKDSNKTSHNGIGTRNPLPEADKDGCTIAVTADQFTSGEITWLLNGKKSDGVWKQTLDGKSYPGFTGGTVYSGYEQCKDTRLYTNDSDKASKLVAAPHDYDSDGFCTQTAGETHYEPCEGEGTAEKPYLIKNAGNLYWFAAQVNSGNTSINARLTADITVNPGKFDADGNYTAVKGETVRVWTPIGNESNKFTGTFDGTLYDDYGNPTGNNHTISGLYFNDTSKDYVGLFGYVGEGGTVDQVDIKDSYIKGKCYVGGVAGKNYGRISNCASSATVSGSSDVGGVVGYNAGIVTNCHNASGTVTGKGSYVGGIAGTNRGTIEHCTSTGAVSGSSKVGGVVGYNAVGTVTNCYNTGTVTGKYYYIGGVAGWNDDTITNCYNTGAVTGDTKVGGVVGSNSNAGNVSNCYYLTGCAKDGNNTVQYGIGNETKGSTTADVDGVTTGKTKDQFISGEVTWLLNGSTSEGTLTWHQKIGTDELPNFTSTQIVYAYTNCVKTTIYTNTQTENGTHGASIFTQNTDSKTHKETCSLCGGTIKKSADCTFDADGFCTVCDGYEKPAQDANGVYQIKNAGNLYWFADFVNKGGENLKANAVLTADIIVNAGTFDANGKFTPKTRTGALPRAWTPIAGYNGTNYIAFIGTFDGQGHTISGLYCNGSDSFVGLFGYVGVSGTVKDLGVLNSYFRGSNTVGGVAGKNEGTVTGCYTTGAVAGTQNIGGVVGLNYGSVGDCYNTGTVTGVDSTVNTQTNIGGVVGHNAKGNTTTGKVENCLNVGTVTANGSYIGAVAGYNDTSCTVNNCYYLSGTAQGAVGNNTGSDNYGKTDEQLKSGEVTWLLSGGRDDSVWKQTVGTNTYPGFTGDKVYNNLEVAGNQQYANERIEIAKVTITWGKMVFSYEGATWDPTSLSWKNNGTWKAADKITIKNDGNVDITAKVSFDLNSAYTQSFGGKVKFTYFDPAQSKDVTAAEVNQTIAVGEDINVTPTIAPDTVPPASFLQSGATGVAIGKITITLDWTPTTTNG